MAASDTNYYEVLGVSAQASQDEIKTAYRALVKQVHPDQGGNPTLFRLVNEAWSVLKTPDLRKEYDRQRSNGYRKNGTSGSGTKSSSANSNSGSRSNGGATSASHTATFTRFIPEDDSRDIKITPDPSFMNIMGATGTAALVMVGMAIITFLLLWMLKKPILVLGIVTLLVGAWFLAKPAIHRIKQYRALDEIITSEDLSSNRIFGSPGAVARQRTSKLGYAESDATSYRAKLTAEIIEPILRIPGTRIVYDPAGGISAAECAIALGNRVAVVCSDVWPGGHYELDPWGDGLVRDGRPFQRTATKAFESAAWLGSRMPDDAQFAAVLIPHSDSNPITAHPTAIKSGMIPPDLAVDVISRWLQQDNEPFSVNRTIIASLLADNESRLANLRIVLGKTGLRD